MVRIAAHSAWLQAEIPLGQSLRVRGEMDHGAMRVDVARAAALARLTRGEASVNFSTLHMLTTAAFSRHIRSP
jgi:hypothetical protein